MIDIKPTTGTKMDAKEERIYEITLQSGLYGWVLNAGGANNQQSSSLKIHLPGCRHIDPHKTAPHTRKIFYRDIAEMEAHIDREFRGTQPKLCQICKNNDSQGTLPDLPTEETGTFPLNPPMRSGASVFAPSGLGIEQ